MAGPGGLTSTDYEKAGVNILASYAASALGKFGIGPNFKGAMAARGYAQAQAKQAEFAFRAQLLQQKFAQAQQDFASTNPFEPGAVFSSVEDAPLKLVKMTAKATAKLNRLNAQDQTKGVVRKERKVIAKLERLTNKAAPYTQVRVGELYGANQGYWREHGAPQPLWLAQGSH